jgi:hypothetical protein
MSNSTPELSQWSRLYQAAIQIKEMAPWEWMSETDVFGVQDPGSDEMGFVSVMGSLGQHYSVAVYLGPSGLYSFWNFQELEPNASDEDFMAMTHLQASFENRNELTQKDRDLIKKLGLKFRGRQAWPMFRSYRPGYFPWYLEPHEARLLTHALEQTLNVAPRFKEDPDLLAPGSNTDYLLRAPQEKEDALAWEDQVVNVLPPEPASIPIAMDVPTLKALMAAPMSRVCLEMDLFLMPIRIGERGERPQFAYMLLVVESESGMVLGSEMLGPDPTLNEMYGALPLNVVHLLAQIGIVPQEIKVRSPMLFQLLQTLTADLKFHLTPSHHLPMLDQAREFITQRFI